MKFEYAVDEQEWKDDESMEQYLNMRGRHRWELVSTDWSRRLTELPYSVQLKATFIFKREILEPYQSRGPL